jgi:transcriptional regulator with XRE-family HTH domain
MRIKHEEFEVLVPNLDDTAVAERVKVSIPLKWDEEIQEWLLTPEAHHIIEDTKARHMGLLLPAQFKELRDRYGFTQKEMGELFQVGEKSWTRWESGKHRPSRSINLLIRALYEGGISLNYLLKRAGKPPREEPEWASSQFVWSFFSHHTKRPDVVFFPGSGSAVAIQYTPSSGKHHFITQLIKLVDQHPWTPKEVFTAKATKSHGRLAIPAPAHAYRQPRLNTPTAA